MIYCWGWSRILVRMRGNNLEQSNNIRILKIARELSDNRMIQFVHCPPRHKAPQTTAGSTWTLQGVRWYFKHMIWKTAQLGWYWKRFAGTASRLPPLTAGHSLHFTKPSSPTELVPVPQAKFAVKGTSVSCLCLSQSWNKAALKAL